MTITKTWVVASDNPREEHAAVDGETVEVHQTFSNGLLYPGDGSTGDPKETAGCTCIMTIEGFAETPTAPSELEYRLDELKAGPREDVVKTADRLMAEFESPLTTMETRDLGAGRFAEYDVKTNTITYNPELINSPKLAEEYWNPPNFRVEGIANPTETVTTHEFGHTLEQAMTDEQWAKIATQVNEETGEPLLSITRKGEMFLDTSEGDSILRLNPLARDDMTAFLKENLSRYGATNGHEFMAEAFTEYRVADEPRLIARLVGEYIDELFSTIPETGPGPISAPMEQLEEAFGGAWVDELSVESKDAVKAYQDFAFEEINAELRGLEVENPISDFTEEQVAEFAAQIDKAFELGPRVPEDMLVYRTGVLPSELTEGRYFTDSAYISTTLDPDTAGTVGRGQLFEIIIPKGSRAIAPEAMVGNGNYAHEAELLLPRNSTFQLVGKTEFGTPIFKLIGG